MADGAGRVPRAVLVAVPAVVLIAAVATRDATAALALAGLGAVLAALVVLMSRSPGRGRRGAVAVLAVGGAGMFLGGTALASPELPAAPAAVALQDRVAAPSATPAPLTARAALAALAVKGAAPMTGYDRTERFGAAWLDVDRNGCDTRNDVLRRDLVDRRETRCRVLSGVLHDPYTGRTIDFVRGPRTSEAVQIDHVVALADAWRTGAQRLSQSRREALANDPAELLAVDGPTNTRKGDGDAATWLPKRKAFRCEYVARQIAVKRAYGLWVVPAERAAMARVLATCPSQPLPAASSSSWSPSPSSSTAATPSTSTTTAGAATAGAFCAPVGGSGRTAAGTAVRCTTAGEGTRARWRAAA